MKTETKKFWLSDPVTKEITFIMEIDLIESISCNDIDGLSICTSSPTNPRYLFPNIKKADLSGFVGYKEQFKEPTEGKPSWRDCFKSFFAGAAIMGLIMTAVIFGLFFAGGAA